MFHEDENDGVTLHFYTGEAFRPMQSDVAVYIVSADKAQYPDVRSEMSRLIRLGYMVGVREDGTSFVY